MGLATSQVRLLALTSRKSDVEFNMQLNAKRKAMLMRESTTLSKLYYAKLQQARYQYSTEEGYNDVTYGYLMGVGNETVEPSIDLIRTGIAKASGRNCPATYIIDASGNVVVNEDLYKAIDGVRTETIDGNNSYKNNFVFSTLVKLCGITDPSTIDKLNGFFGSNDFKKAYEHLYVKNYIANKDSQDNYDLYYGDYAWGNSTDSANIVIGNSNGTITQNQFNSLTKNDLKEVMNLYQYYGSMLEYIFSKGKDQPKIASQEAYNNLLDVDYLQEAFRSGTFTLMAIKEDGGDTQGLDYFINKAYFVEKADTESRETITAWYNAQKAELDEKETYWDSEINALSTELETINTELESIKSLRDNAIQTTFKWGAA